MRYQIKTVEGSTLGTSPRKKNFANTALPSAISQLMSFDPARDAFESRTRLPVPVSYRDLEEIMAERGVDLDHATLNRWVEKYADLR